MTFKGTAVILCVFLLWPTCQGFMCTGNHQISVEEGQQLSLTCQTPDDGTPYVRWVLQNPAFDSIGACYLLDGHSCFTNRPDRCQLTTNGSWTEMVVKGNLQATIAGRVECERGYVLNSRFITLSTEICHIRVTYPADKVTNCQVHWDPSQNWTVSGECDVEKLHPTDQHQYICRWRHKAWKTDAMPINRCEGKCRFRGLHLNKDNITGSDLSLYIDRGDGWMLAKSFQTSDVSTFTPSSAVDDPPVAVIAGAVGAGIILLIVVVVIVVVVVKRRKGRHHDNVTSPHQGRPPMVPDRQQEVMSSAASDDDYSTLNFHSDAARQSGRDPEAQYSHIGAMVRGKRT